jgi:hypothetical protein
MTTSRLQAEPPACARFEHEAFKLAPQQLAARRALTNGENSTPHGGAEPLDKARLADDQAISLR